MSTRLLCSSQLDPLAGSTCDFVHRPGPDLFANARAFAEWSDARVRYGGFPYGKRLTGAPTPRTALRFLDGAPCVRASTSPRRTIWGSPPTRM